jgi:hypothetical protein
MGNLKTASDEISAFEKVDPTIRRSIRSKIAFDFDRRMKSRIRASRADRIRTALAEL